MVQVAGSDPQLPMSRQRHFSDLGRAALLQAVEPQLLLDGPSQLRIEHRKSVILDIFLQELLEACKADNQATCDASPNSSCKELA
jgi:hypothetical protein